MPRPIPLKLVLKILRQKGFSLTGQKGSHAKFRKEKNKAKRLVIIKTTKKEIPHGTFQAILLQSGLKETDFRKK